MEKPKAKALIVMANVIGVIAIISIILLYNNKTDPVSIKDDETKVSDTEEIEDVDSEQTIETQYIKNKESHESEEDIKKKESDDDSDSKKKEDKAEDTPEDEKKIKDVKKSDDTESVAKVDSDGDGLTDKKELDKYGTNPNSADTDSDGLDDGKEIKLGTNPNHNDTDRDGIKDGDEVANGTNPLKAASKSSSSYDSKDNNKKTESKQDKEEKEEQKCGSGQIKVDGKCEDKKPLSYDEKVQNRLPGYKVSGGNPIVIINKDGKVAEVINKKIIFRTDNTDIYNEIINKLNGLAKP